jgi:hypothetical protein
MTDIEGQREWLALLKAERARRAARTEWKEGEDERAREQFLEELQQMALRFAALATTQPLELDDMSPVEMLACNMLPESMRPAGLPTEDQIWREYRARRTP